MHVAVLASGSGTNLQALLDHCRTGAAAQVTLVVSNTTSARALERAHAAGVATHVLMDHRDGRELTETLAAHRTDLVVLAGYLKLVPPATVDAYAGRMINLHPALLPAFGGKGMYGSNVHRAVLDSGATITGVSIHLVTHEYDRGPVIAQWPVPVAADDTPDALAARIRHVEHALLPAVVLAAARAGRVVRLVPKGNVFTLTADAEAIPELLLPAALPAQSPR